MPNLNKVSLMGHLTRDPELRHTPKGMPIAKLGLAINRNWTTEGGEKKEEATFVDVVSFGKQAETLSKFVRKGDPLYVGGRLHLETWDDKATGQKRSKTVVVLEDFQFLSSKRDAARAPVAAPADDAPPADSSDIPF